MSNANGSCSMIPLWKSKRRFYRHLKACYRSPNNILKEKDLHKKPSVLSSLCEFCDMFRACCGIFRLRRTRIYLMLPLTALILLLLIFFQEDSSAYLSNEPSYRRGLFGGFLPWSPQAAAILETFTPFSLLEVNCPAILQGDIDQIDFTKDMLYKENHKWATDARMIEVFQNCTRLRGYMDSSSDSEATLDLPQAYIINLQHNAYQLHLLMQTIYSSQNFYCFTLTSSASPLFKRAVRTFADCHPNIIIQNVSHSPNPIYVGYSILDAELKCMDQLRHFDNWKYVMNLPEDAFPLFPKQNISNKLKSLQGHNHIPGKLLNSTLMWKKHLPVQDLTLYYGSQYYIATKEFAEYVCANKLPKQILQYFNSTHIAEDPRQLYWATINSMKHTPGGQMTSGVDLLPFVKSNGDSKCQGDECTVLIDDLVRLKSETNLFTLGLDSDTDHVAIQCLAAFVKNSTYWSNARPSK